jgi:isopenicillin N synthase-like dioxygenase
LSAANNGNNMQNFPVIDISTFTAASQGAKQALAARVDEVCRQTGFLAIVGHGIPGEICAGAWDAARRFFDQPLDKKLEVKMPYPGYPYGYAPLQAEVLARSLGDETPPDFPPDFHPDLKETFSIGAIDRSQLTAEMLDEGFRFAPNLWPREPVELRGAWSAYYRATSELAAFIMRIFAIALDLPEGFFDDKFDQHSSAMRAVNYPRLSTPVMPGQFRAGAHTDYGSLTILYTEQDPGGLEIYTPDGQWRKVPPVPGALIVNIGDLMARWTNDRWVSTLHRVISPFSDEGGSPRRVSIAFFHQPNWDTEISCIPSCLVPGEKAKYPPVRSGAHLMEKFLRTVTHDRQSMIRSKGSRQ